MSDKEAFTVIATSAIPEVREVRFYEETIPHIAEQHPEFKTFVPSLEHAIADTIAAPTIVLKSAFPHQGSFKFCSTNHTYMGNATLVVPVKVVEGSSALLKTAYFTSNEVKGEIVKGKSND